MTSSMAHSDNMEALQIIADRGDPLIYAKQNIPVLSNLSFADGTRTIIGVNSLRTIDSHTLITEIPWS